MAGREELKLTGLSQEGTWNVQQPCYVVLNLHSPNHKTTEHHGAPTGGCNLKFDGGAPDSNREWKCKPNPKEEWG